MLLRDFVFKFTSSSSVLCSCNDKTDYLIGAVLCVEDLSLLVTLGHKKQGFTDGLDVCVIHYSSVFRIVHLIWMKTSDNRHYDCFILNFLSAMCGCEFFLFFFFLPFIVFVYYYYYHFYRDIFVQVL